MARETIDGMFASAKGKQEKKVRQLQCQEQYNDHIPYCLSGLLHTHFPDNLSRNSCIYICLISLKRGHWTFVWCRAQPGAQKCRGLDVLVGTAG